MDFFNKAKNALGGTGGASHGTSKPAGQGDDYVDKGLSMIQKKLGMSSNKATNEKLTDQGRALYEKQTGKKVSSKVCVYPWLAYKLVH